MRYQPYSQNEISPVVKKIIIANVVLFILTYLAHSNYIDLNDHLALYFPANKSFKIFQLITYMFMHGGIMHLAMNMISLFIFGPKLESIWGAKRFTIFYFVCGIGSALFYLGVNAYEYFKIIANADQYIRNASLDQFILFVNKNGLNYHTGGLYAQWQSIIQDWQNQSNNSEYLKYSIEQVTAYKNDITLYDNRFAGLVGASGAVFGVMFAYAYLFPNTVLYFRLAIPVKAKYFVLIYGAMEFYASYNYIPGDNVAHLAHLGGMLVGFLLVLYWQKFDKTKFY